MIDFVERRKLMDISQEASLSILDSITAAKKSIIEGGVTSVSSGGRSVGFIPLQTLEEVEQRERMKAADGIYAKTIQSTPYDTKW